MPFPNPRFLTEMGMASILAGVVMLGLAYTQKLWRRVR